MQNYTSGNKTINVLKMVRYLQRLKNGVTRESLCLRYEVDSRTISRYLKSIEDVGFQIIKFQRNVTEKAVYRIEN